MWCLTPGFRGHPVASCDVPLAFVEWMRYGKSAKNSEFLGPYVPVPTYKLWCLGSTNAPQIDCGILLDRVEGKIAPGLVTVHSQALH